MRGKRSYLVTAVVVAAAAYYSWWIFWSGDNFYPHSANAGNREAILRVHSALGVGDDRDTVLKEYWSQRTPDLRLHVDAPARWIVSMPGELGGNDWTLIVEFPDAKVFAVRVRTADGQRPTGSPPDKGPPDA